MENRWHARAAEGLEGRELLAHVTDLMGREGDLVLGGGGNTSLKARETDHLGRSVEVLLVKPSGLPLEGLDAADFTALRLDDLAPLESREELEDETMAAFVRRSQLDPDAHRSSIEALLHAFLPDRWVLHSHADALLALGNRPDGSERVRAVLGDSVAVVPYRRPGFLLSKEVAEARRNAPEADGVVLLKHGLVTWGDDARTAYERHIGIVTACEEASPLTACGPAPGPDPDRAVDLAPRLRGALGERRILRFDHSAETLAFLDDESLLAATQHGPATADHILLTGPRPRVLRDAPEDLDGEPKILLVPGVGMWAAGRNREDADAALEIYRHTMRMIRRAGGAWEPIHGADARHAENWPLQTRKLDDRPPEGELASRIAWISGAASGLGRDIARRFAREGAHLFLTDVDEEGLEALAAELGPRAAVRPCDVTDEARVEESFRATVLEFGGLDVVVSNAGIAQPRNIEDLSREEWERSLAVNATGHFLVSRAAMRILRAQGLGGSIVFNASKNVLAPGKGFSAYSAAKAAESQLGKVLALEAADVGVRVNLLHPDAIFRGTRLWSDELKRERAKAHGVPVEKIEEFYATRNLLKVAVRGEDVAEAALFFASDRSSRTTGACLTIDGGVKEAFPR
jgi:rhamnose utilization protein RhaD (predicted bifunctional aldolase and dehydrogenase)/NAD(P)-dependent dehydrogenase (short-subunit alcohol dehydrogenase family)